MHLYTDKWPDVRMRLQGLSFQKVESWKLYGMVGAMVLIDAVILTAWQLVDPMKRELEIFPLEDPEMSDEDVKIEPALEHCESKNHAIWLGAYSALCG